MNKWESVKLGEVCNMKSGGTPSRKKLSFFGGNIKWCKISDIENATKGIVYDTEEKITEEGLSDINGRIFPKGTLLLAIYGSVGKVAFINEQMSVNQAILGINIKNLDILDSKFLYYWFIGERRNLLNKAVGVTLKNISKGIVENLTIPLPPLSIQQEIAERLDKMAILIEKSKAQLSHYDALAESLFIELFGDPISNEKGWEKKKLGEVCVKITDGTHDTPQRLEEGIKFITGKHIKPFYIDYNNSDYVTEEVHKQIYSRCNPEYGDILYTNIGVNYATAAMNTVDYEFSMKNVALLKYRRENLTGRFLEYLLNNKDYKDRLKVKMGVGGAQQFLSLKQINAIEILIPPLSLQIKFAEMVENIEEQKAKIRAEIEQAEQGFQALLQESF